MREIREMEAKDEIFAGRVKMMREDNAAILRKLPFEKLSEKMDALPHHAANTQTGSLKVLKMAAALVVALGIISAIFLNRDVEVVNVAGSSMEVALVDTQDGDTRIKGLSARMEVWKKTGDSAVQLANLSEVREGDEIQLRYAVPEKCFGMLFSLDGNGTLTMHMGDGSQAIALEPGKMTTLPFAYKLDNAPKFEKFFFVTSREAFDVDASNLDALLKNKNVNAVSVNLRKVEGN